jgi:hypothetical protein
LRPRARFLSEQYLLQAFLIDNPNWQVLLATHSLWREQFDALSAVVPDAARAPFSPALPPTRDSSPAPVIRSG